MLRLEKTMSWAASLILCLIADLGDAIECEHCTIILNQDKLLLLTEFNASNSTAPERVDKYPMMCCSGELNQNSESMSDPGAHLTSYFPLSFL
jgi:hypothetical protein